MGDNTPKPTAQENGSAQGGDSKNESTAIIFSLPQNSGSLADALKVLEKHKVNFLHIESRSSREKKDCHEFLVTLDNGQGEIEKAVADLKICTSRLQVLDVPSDAKDQKDEVPWIPRKLEDLNVCLSRIIHENLGLDENHPGYNDQAYLARRKEFSDIAFSYRYGQPIPQIQYRPEEIQTWRAIYSRVTKLHKLYACEEYNTGFALMEKEGGLCEDHIPQLKDISAILKAHTGFQVWPVAGYLSPRDFLACMAHRVFPATQYIRHQSKAFYTPEPDICHEVIGHSPLFTNPDFAQFSQEIGLASLGASDEYIDKLSNLYWFTLEFGVCRQNGDLKAYGAGLLSSVEEIQYCVTDKPKVLPFDPLKMTVQSYPLTSYQPLYFAADSFYEATEKLKAWAETIPRPISVRYHRDTQTIEVVESKDQILAMLDTIQADLSFLQDAVKRVK